MKTLHAVVDGYTQRTGRNTLRNYLLGAMALQLYDGVGWSIGPKSAAQFYLIDNHLGPTLDQDSDPQWTKGRETVLLIFEAARVLAGLSPQSDINNAGTFIFEFDQHIVSVDVWFQSLGEVERVELRFKCTAADRLAAQQIVLSGILLSTPCMDDENDAKFMSKFANERGKWISASLVTLVSSGLAFGTAQELNWFIRLPTFLWGAIVVPLTMWWGIQQPSNFPRIRWLSFVILLMFVGLLWFPGIVATLYTGSWLRLDLFFTSWCGFLMFIWLWVLRVATRPQLPLEPI